MEITFTTELGTCNSTIAGDIYLINYPITLFSVYPGVHLEAMVGT